MTRQPLDTGILDLAASRIVEYWYVERKDLNLIDGRPNDGH